MPLGLRVVHWRRNKRPFSDGHSEQNTCQWMKSFQVRKHLTHLGEDCRLGYLVRCLVFLRERDGKGSLRLIRIFFSETDCWLSSGFAMFPSLEKVAATWSKPGRNRLDVGQQGSGSEA